MKNKIIPLLNLKAVCALSNTGRRIFEEIADDSFGTMRLEEEGQMILEKFLKDLSERLKLVEEVEELKDLRQKIEQDKARITKDTSFRNIHLWLQEIHNIIDRIFWNYSEKEFDIPRPKQ